MGIYSIVIALLKVVWTLARMLLLSTQIQGRSWYCWWHEIERANFVSKIWCMLLDRSHNSRWFDIACSGAVSDSNLRSHASFWLCKVNARSRDMQALIGDYSGAWIGWNYYAGFRRLVLVRFQLFIYLLISCFTSVMRSPTRCSCDIDQVLPYKCAILSITLLPVHVRMEGGYDFRTKYWCHRVLVVLLRIRFICISLSKCW